MVCACTMYTSYSYVVGLIYMYKYYVQVHNIIFTMYKYWYDVYIYLVLVCTCTVYVVQGKVASTSYGQSTVDVCTDRYVYLYLSIYIYIYIIIYYICVVAASLD